MLEKDMRGHSLEGDGESGWLMFRKAFDNRIRCAYNNILSLENMTLEEASKVLDTGISL